MSNIPEFHGNPNDLDFNPEFVFQLKEEIRLIKDKNENLDDMITAEHTLNESILKKNQRLTDIIIGADFLIKKLSLDRDLSEGMETHINDFQEDMKPIIKEMSKVFEG